MAQIHQANADDFRLRASPYRVRGQLSVDGDRELTRLAAEGDAAAYDAVPITDAELALVDAADWDRPRIGRTGHDAARGGGGRRRAGWRPARARAHPRPRGQPQTGGG